MTPPATTVAAWLATLPPERRAAIRAVRALVKKHLPRGYQETLAHGMLAWVVPLRDCPHTYNGQPLLYAALGSPKGYMALHLMSVYGDGEVARGFRAAYAAAGKRLDMGKACVHFRSLDELELPAVAAAIAACPAAEYVARARAAHSPAARAKRRATRTAAAKPAGDGSPRSQRARPAAKRTPAAKRRAR